MHIWNAFLYAKIAFARHISFGVQQNLHGHFFFLFRFSAMLTHHQIWSAIDALALRSDLTPSGLAKLAGLDPTTFNKSKRKTAEGKERWPSTESIAKILEVTDNTIEDFAVLISSTQSKQMERLQHLPMISSDQVLHFDTIPSSAPTPHTEIDTIPLADLVSKDSFVLEVEGHILEPYFFEGTLLIISPLSSSLLSNLRPNDLMVFKSNTKSLNVGYFVRKTVKVLELKKHSQDDQITSHALSEIQWMGRVLWATQ